MDKLLRIAQREAQSGHPEDLRFYIKLLERTLGISAEQGPASCAVN